MLPVLLFVSTLLPPVNGIIFEYNSPDYGEVILIHEEAEASSRLKEGEGYIDGEKIALPLERIDGEDLDGKPLWFRQGSPAKALTKLIEKASNRGFRLQINYAYRTYAQQDRLYRRNPKLAGRPGQGGERTHQTGCSIDLEGTRRFVPYDKVSPEHFNTEHCTKNKSRGGWYCKTKFYWWLKRHAGMFKNDVENEPWHWTYVGPLGDEAVGGD